MLACIPPRLAAMVAPAWEHVAHSFISPVSTPFCLKKGALMADVTDVEHRCASDERLHEDSRIARASSSRNT
jgi:hypothetical protein